MERDRKAWRAPEGGRRVDEASKSTNEGDDGDVRVCPPYGMLLWTRRAELN